MSSASDELSKTLTLALSQAQNQVKTIHEQAAQIERLQRENARLSNELHCAKQQQTDTAAVRNASPQVEDLFQKYVEARAETQKLKKKLKQFKEKANGLLSTPLSSPSTSPAPPLTSSSKIIQPPSRDTEAVSERALSSPPRKRPKLAGDGIREVPPNDMRVKSTNGDNLVVGRMLSEDGEQVQQEHLAEGKLSKDLRRQEPFHKRLDGLLAAPSPNRAILNQPISPASTDTSLPSSSLARSLKISNILHATSEGPTLTYAGKNNDASKVIAARDTDNKRPRPVQEGAPSAQKNLSLMGKAERLRDNGRPIRERSLADISLQHFKPNPIWLDSHGVSFDEFLQGQNAKRIDALVKTLPQLPGQNSKDGPEVENELLLDFLGPGSEDKIASLTRTARANLLSEAKTRRVAQYFARTQADPDHEQNPPGFWSIDMPGTQEAEANREKAKTIERAEIRRRYEEAVIGNSRWVFADE